MGTILLLALTVTLFSSIFFFVNTFPRPPPQPANQFQASIQYGPVTGGKIPLQSVTIIHLAGPTLSGPGVLFYLYSSAHPTRFTAPYHLSDGLNGSSIWSIGQNWFLNISSKALTVPDNITISIATQTELLFRVTLPGQNPNIPPEFVNAGTSPVSPAIGQGFQIFVQIIDDDLRTNSVFVNISQLPGVTGSGFFPLSFNAVTGLWTYSVANAVTTAAGSFFVFVNATDGANQANSIAVPVTISPGTVTQANVVVGANPSLPVVGSPVTLVAYVTNPGAGSASVNVTFTAGGTTVGFANGPLGGGSSATFTTTWTPSSTGPITVGALANVTTGGSVSGTLNLTVFPKILLIAHNVVAGTFTASNESAYLAESLVSAGIPFTSMFISCTSALPTSAALQAYGVVIIDFGSANAGSCLTSPATTEQAKITGAVGTNFWIVGANAFSATACNSYNAAFYNQFGIKFTAGSTCNAIQTLGSAATWNSAPASGIRSDGLAGLTINTTLAGSNAFRPYVTFSLGTTNTGLLVAGGKSLSSWLTSGSARNVATATDPALLAESLPNGNSWITNGAGTEVAFNVINYLCGFATAASPGHGLVDGAVGGVTVWGVNHAKTTTVYADLRTNGPSAMTLTVTLYINGSAATFNGIIVSATAVVGANGGSTTVSLVWEAPSSGIYTLSIVVTPNDFYPVNNQLPISILNQPTKFA